MRVLVVGANGQLGAQACERLLEHGHHVRGSVRAPERARGLPGGVEVVEADVATGRGVADAFAGVDAVLVSANPVAARKGDSARAFHDGALRLVEVAETAGVRRFVFPSVAVTPLDDKVPPLGSRRRLEERLARSDLPHVAVRLAPFTDAWLGLVGSSLPSRGEEHSLLDRPSPFLRRFRRLTGTAVERHGLMLVPGPPTARHAFITVHDATTALVAALDREPCPPAVVEVGGPEMLSWREVAAVFGDVLDRRVRILSTPAPVYAVLAGLLRPFSEIASHTMSLNRAACVSDSAWEPGGGLVDPATMTTVREFLEQKAGLPA